MTVLDTAMRATASRLLNAYGKQMQVRRDVRSDYRPSSGDFITESYIDTNVRGLFLSYTSRQIDGTTILVGDRQVLLAALDLSEAPRAGDHIVIDSEIWNVVNVTADYSGEEAAIYTAQVRV